MKRRTSAPDRVLATVMFTDIVGSTQRAAELGDRRWRDLLARHHAIVRAELRRFGGREIDTAGDGFFATFERPARAVECAAAIRSRVAPLGLEIRAAIHMGECEVMGSKLGGITVHATARVLTLAEPGQILVTGTIRDLTAGSDVLYEERGTHELKGVPGEWRVLSVERMAREDIEEEVAAAEPADRAARRRPMTILGVAAALIAAVVAGVVIANGRSSKVRVTANSVVRFDPATNEVAAAASIKNPTSLSLAEDGVVWVGTGDNTLHAIDPDDGTIAKTIGLPGPPTSIANAPGSVWVTFGFGAQGLGDETLQRLSTATDSFEDRIALGHGVDAIAADDESAWVLDEVGERTARVDPDVGTIVSRARTGEAPKDLVLAENALWIVNSLGSSVWQLDPVSLKRMGEVALTVRPSDVAYGFDRIWAASELDQKVAVIDAKDLSIIATVGLDQRPVAIGVGDDAVWVIGERGRLSRIDPHSLKEDTVITLPGIPHDLISSGTGLWIALGR
ncbi:MAG: adenylate/guanylate cyclase domain-containing protein [Actinomycetota bacterium]